MLKKIASFIKTKLSVAIEKNTSLEDQYSEAANLIITQITELRQRHVDATAEESNLYRSIRLKQDQKDKKDKEILSIIANGGKPETHVKLAILYTRTIEAYRARQSELAVMKSSIDRTVVELDEHRQDLAVKLEYVRETQKANAMGINTEDDVIQIAGTTVVNVQDIMMRIETFTPGTTHDTTTTSTDISEYLATLGK
ncbi:MAG: hypothetical protein ACRCWQ_02770 [Bacilli bacterium]